MLGELNILTYYEPSNGIDWLVQVNCSKNARYRISLSAIISIDVLAPLVSLIRFNYPNTGTLM